MASVPDALLHRIEALPGAGRFAVAFRRLDGGEQVAVVEVTSEGIQIAEASLPDGWTHDGDAYRALADSVRAMHRARSTPISAPRLVDVPGGWDVGLGNVVLSADGVPTCTAHGPMTDGKSTWECLECGARAVLAAAD